MRFEVKLTETEIYTMEVHAKSEAEAIDKAYERIETDHGKCLYHNASDGYSEAFEIKE